MAAVPHPGAVRGAARLLLRDVAHALRGPAVRLAAGGVEGGHGGDVLRPDRAGAGGASVGGARARPGDERGPSGMKRRSFLAAAGAGCLGWTVGKPFPQRRSPGGERLVVRWAWAVGQSVKLLLFVHDEDAGLEAAQAALAELRRVEAALSLFDPASDLVALNQRAGKGPVRGAPALLAVLVAAERFRRVTGGAFDPAVEPLMRAWGFREPRAAAP